MNQRNSIIINFNNEHIQKVCITSEENTDLSFQIIANYWKNVLNNVEIEEKYRYVKIYDDKDFLTIYVEKYNEKI